MAHGVQTNDTRRQSRLVKQKVNELSQKAYGEGTIDNTLIYSATIAQGTLGDQSISELEALKENIIDLKNKSKADNERAIMNQMMNLKEQSMVQNSAD
jgi:hypothetical protein